MRAVCVGFAFPSVDWRAPLQLHLCAIKCVQRACNYYYTTATVHHRFITTIVAKAELPILCIYIPPMIIYLMWNNNDYILLDYYNRYVVVFIVPVYRVIYQACSFVFSTSVIQLRSNSDFRFEYHVFKFLRIVFCGDFYCKLFFG